VFLVNKLGGIRKRKDILFSAVFLSPSMILYTLFIIIPIFMSLYYALTRWNMVTTPVFIGLDNYIHLFTSDPDFRAVMKNTFIGFFLSLLIEIPFSALFAYIVYRTKGGFKFFQSVFFMPAVISGAIVGLLYFLFFNSQFGPINALLKAVGLGFLQQNWLSNKSVVLYSVMMPMLWQMIGYYFIIIFAGFQSIPYEIIESSVIDGANSVNVFFRIAIPLNKDVLQVCIILCATSIFKYFDIPYMMTGGGPGTQSSFLSLYMFKTAYLAEYFGRGCAIGNILLALAILTTVIMNFIFSIGEERI